MLDDSVFAAGASLDELGGLDDCANAAVVKAALNAVVNINCLSILASSRSQMIPQRQRVAMIGVPK
jgi:hypothetical protein